MKTLFLCAALMLSGCATQVHERMTEIDPETEKVVKKVCRTESNTFFRMTEAESIKGVIRCDEKGATEFGVEGFSGAVDANVAGAIAEGAARGARPGP